MTRHSRRSKLRSSQGNEERDGRAKKCYQRKNRLECGQNGQEDRLTLHPSGPGMPGTFKVLSAPARAI